MDLWTRVSRTLVLLVVSTSVVLAATPTPTPTTPTPSTPSPTTPTVTSQSPPVNNYTVTNGDTTCIIMTAAIKLTIPYPSPQTNTASLALSKPFSVNGTCDNTHGVNVINIYFHDNWHLTLVFVNSSSTAYEWNQTTLSYVRDPMVFVNISRQYVNTRDTKTTIFSPGTNTGNINGSFACTGTTTLSLNGSISMEITSLQYTAFQTGKEAWFSTKDVSTCLTDTPVPDTNAALAVSVGIALAVMIAVIVLLFLVISKAWRRDKQED